EVDMVVALSWVDKQFDLREKFNEAKEKLASVGWQNLEDKIILSACKARLDRKLINSDAEKTSEALKEQPEIITEITKNLIRVTQFLNQYCGIQSPQILPYQNQIVILAEAFRIQPEFNKEIQQQLQDWFWFTAYTELFNGIKENGIQEALDTVRAIVKAEKKDYRYSTTIEPLGKRFNFRAARAKLLLLRLAELEPIDFKGKSINVRALLSVHGKDAVLRLFNNNSAPENCFIFKPKQRFDFRDYLLKNNQWDTDFLQRHAISKSAAQALQQGNENEFLSERRQTLIEIEKAFIKPLGLDYHASAI
ncbi:MAG: hypothetical protein SVR94_07975, partial [Pseudomonadota bacterium]|nr:hypothetical protein [Pseudomonadota bacterium]